MLAIAVGATLVVVGAAVLVHHRRGRKDALRRHLFRRIRATDEQKQRLSALFDDAHARLGATRDRLRSFAQDLVEILESSPMDRQRLETLEARVFESVGEGSQVLREVITQAHETLEPDQRRQIADWLRRVQRRHHTCCPAGCHC